MMMMVMKDQRVSVATAHEIQNLTMEQANRSFEMSFSLRKVNISNIIVSQMFSASPACFSRLLRAAAVYLCSRF